MSWHDQVIEAFKRNDVQFVVYLPDSVLGPLIDELDDDEYFDTVLAAREEEAVGILSGAWMGGRRGALLCQSSGLANSFNALGSLSKPTRLPFLGVVTRRGDLDDHNLAHAAAEYPMPRLLDEIGVRNHLVSSPGDVGEFVDMAATTSFSQEEPYVLLLEPMVARRAE